MMVVTKRLTAVCCCLLGTSRGSERSLVHRDVEAAFASYKGAEVMVETREV